MPEPFTGDQALNLLMGEVIAEGGRPYVDLWDLKHPGVFFFFAAGGSLFAFSEVGIHLFELLWMLALAVTARVVAGHHLRSRLAVGLAPLLTVGSYYAAASSFHLTQTESLVGLPLLLSLAASLAAARSAGPRRHLWLLASGLGAGVVAVFKVPYAGLPVLFWLIALVEWRRARGEPIAGLAARMAGPLLVGALLPVVAVVAYLAQRSGLDVVWWTFAVHPREAAGQSGVEPQRLFDSSVWFVRTFALPLALSAVGAWHRLRRGWDGLTVALVAWLTAGALLIWMQVISWWAYHYMLLVVPAGLLAAQGVEALWQMVASRATRRRTVAVVLFVCLAALALPLVQPAAQTVAAVLRASPLDSASLRSHQAERNPAYAEVLETTSFLREPGSHGGPIYVFASPLLYHLSERRPAIPYLAPWFHPTPELWDRLTAQLDDASPPYVLVREAALESMVDYNPAMQDDFRAVGSRLEQRYEKLRVDEGGTWYVRRDVRP